LEPQLEPHPVWPLEILQIKRLPAATSRFDMHRITPLPKGTASIFSPIDDQYLASG
jgi:hypothetical protein